MDVKKIANVNGGEEQNVFAQKLHHRV